MADNEEIGLDLTIRTAKAGDGAEATVAGLREVKAEAKEATEAIGEMGAASAEAPAQWARGPDTVQAEAAARMAALEKEAAGEEEITDLQRQQQAIVSSKLEVAELLAAGRQQEAAELQVEIEQMTVAVGLQKQLGISEAEAAALAARAQEMRIEQEEREIAAELAAQERRNEAVIAENEIAEAKQAQAAAAAETAAADSEDAATSGLRGVGDTGRAAGMLAGAAGLSEYAGAIGLAVFAGIELKRRIDEATASIEKQIAAENRADEAFRKQLDLLADRGTIEQWHEALTKIYDDIADKQEERSTATGEEAAKLDEEIT